ncbi:MAG: UTP--glucose-1-phosphate uridylyltransferase [Myxococcales bacterium]|nr:UTP--glucose-1-phosphate uridylyltransferase [Myxococcales bacterium]
MNALPPDVRAVVAKSGLSPELVEALCARLRHRGALGESVLRGHLAQPASSDIAQAPTTPALCEKLTDEGEAALQTGGVGLVVLNGGMATRFDGAVKGCVTALDDISFLGLKLRDALRAAERAKAPPPPVLLMNSRATAAATAAHLEAHGWFGYPKARIWAFEQHWAPRFTPTGDLFLGADQQPSFYGPGHGDLLPCLRESGLLARFAAAGGRTLLMSNVDNALATLDPVLLGDHGRRAEPITVEVVDKAPGDRGGIPLRVDGHLQVVEAFRLPADFDQDAVPVFNTNTFWLDIDAFEANVELTWFAVQKDVEGRPAVQFERLIGELTAHLPTRFVRVPREGARSRFIPVKTPEDLDAARAALRRAWQREEA